MPTAVDDTQKKLNHERGMDLIRQLRREGFIISVGDQVDEEVCAEAKCECGRVGMRYYPFRHRQNLKRYRAVSVCPNCNKTEEF